MDLWSVYGYLVYFTAIWSVLRPFSILFPILVYCIKKDLAILLMSRNVFCGTLLRFRNDNNYPIVNGMALPLCFNWMEMLKPLLPNYVPHTAVNSGQKKNSVQYCFLTFILASNSNQFCHLPIQNLIIQNVGYAFVNCAS
jgi:hypothetical protein